LDIPYDQEVKIIYTTPETPLQITDLDKYIADKTEESASIQLLEIAFRYQGTMRRTHFEVPQGIREEPSGAMGAEGTWSGPEEKTATIEANYKTAESNLKAAKDALELSMRTGINQLRSLEEAYESKKIDVDKAIDTYNTTAINYETGGVVIYDVLLAQMNLLNAEAALKQNRLDYAAARYTFENPS
jgi:hypothetical protein